MGRSEKAGKKRIVFIGKRNVGKSSLVNAFLGREECKADKSHEVPKENLEIQFDLPPYGAVIVVDTLPLTEDSEQKISSFLSSNISATDFVIVVLDAREKLSTEDKSIFYHFKKMSIPFIAAVNKIEFGINSDLVNGLRALNIIHFEISCKENVGIDAMKSHITRMLLANTSKTGSRKS